MTIDDILSSVANDSAPAADLSPELQALWYTKAGEWEAAHDIAQDIHSPMGSWLHAMLHLIEGDIGNAGYWFRNAGKPARTTNQTDELWTEIATELLS